MAAALDVVGYTAAPAKAPPAAGDVLEQSAFAFAVGSSVLVVEVREVAVNTA